TLCGAWCDMGAARKSGRARRFRDRGLNNDLHRVVEFGVVAVVDRMHRPEEHWNRRQPRRQEADFRADRRLQARRRGGHLAWRPRHHQRMQGLRPMNETKPRRTFLPWEELRTRLGEGPHFNTMRGTPDYREAVSRQVSA